MGETAGTHFGVQQTLQRAQTAVASAAGTGAEASTGTGTRTRAKTVAGTDVCKGRRRGRHSDLRVGGSQVDMRRSGRTGYGRRESLRMRCTSVARLFVTLGG